MIWYAVMLDKADNDWGTGDHDKEKAVNMVKQLRKNGYPDSYIAVINVDHDPICTQEIYDIDEELKGK